MGASVDIQDPLALPVAAAALSRHAEYLRQVSHGITEKSAVIHRRVDGVLIQFRGQLVAAEAALRTVPLGDYPAREVAQRRVRIAQRTLSNAIGLKRQLDSALYELDQTARVQVSAVQRTVERGMNGLQRFWEELGRAVAQFGLAVRSDPLLSAPASAPRPPAVVAVAAHKTTSIGSDGHVMVDLSLIDIESNISGPEDFAKVSLAEMKDGIAKLESTVLPVVARGGGLAELRVRDTHGRGRGASYTDVYEAFFGATSIKLARKPDGRYEVINGRHRIWAARQIGLDTLPVLVKDLE